MPSSNNQAGQGRRFGPKPFNFRYILSPYPPVANHLANPIDSLSLADETTSQTTTQDIPSGNEPVICSRRSCSNPVRAKRKQCGNCIDKNAAQKRARVQQRRNQGIKDPITGAAVATRRKLLRTRSPTIDDVRRVYVQDAVGRWTERDPVAKGVILRSITSTTRRRNRQDKEYFVDTTRGTTICRK
ncbi:uncharacterized protein FRV6_03102 [Fusarium oxysporum]|uniref:Uncharacterized protein n=1 Tax=Fusarium oxysporum TaxID=5507 RepID=A0A2H3SUL3_FUSOX|nr:uncharacterized protein FRV6_03102 [Fusarium oxysporum]